MKELYVALDVAFVVSQLEIEDILGVHERINILPLLAILGPRRNGHWVSNQTKAVATSLRAIKTLPRRLKLRSPSTQNDQCPKAQIWWMHSGPYELNKSSSTKNLNCFIYNISMCEANSKYLVNC